MKYYGIGKEGSFNWRISLFWGSNMLTIAFYTKLHKFKPRFYYYKDQTFDTGFLIINWFIGLKIG